MIQQPTNGLRSARSDGVMERSCRRRERTQIKNGLGQEVEGSDVRVADGGLQREMEVLGPDGGVLLEQLGRSRKVAGKDGLMNALDRRRTFPVLPAMARPAQTIVGSVSALEYLNATTGAAYLRFAHGT
jgi:hypothetical protein